MSCIRHLRHSKNSQADTVFRKPRFKRICVSVGEDVQRPVFATTCIAAASTQRKSEHSQPQHGGPTSQQAQQRTPPSQTPPCGEE